MGHLTCPIPILNLSLIMVQEAVSRFITAWWMMQVISFLSGL